MITRKVVEDALRSLVACSDELAELDGALGDGDLGLTVSAGAVAAADALAAQDSQADLGSLLDSAGVSFGRANPSTFAALCRGALGDMARSRPRADSAQDVAALLEIAAGSIAKRGSAASGDKTVLDPILASSRSLQSESSFDAAAVRRMAAAALAITTELAAQPSRRGRAAWLQDRSAGHPDAGSVAYVRFLEALARAWEAVPSQSG